MLLTPTEAWEAVVATIGKDLGQVDKTDLDALTAGLLRRAAAVRCPCARADLVDALSESLVDMAPPEIGSRETLDGVLDQLLAAGDLIEVERDMGQPVIYLSPPRFVARRNSILVMGGYADTGLPLSPELRINLVSRHAHRFLRIGRTDETTEALGALGFFPYPMDAWTSSPYITESMELVDSLNQRLRAAGRAGDVPELVLLDQSDTRAYYRSRWRTPRAESGRFVGRRPQKWGAPMWCYVELEDGKPIRLVDLPSIDPRYRACDEAWWLQFAIDATLGQPQEARVQDDTEGFSTISVRMPLPGWAARRLLLVGDLLPRAHPGFLFTYVVWKDEVEEEVAFLAEHLWCGRSNS